MSLFEVTLHSETSYAIKEAFKYFGQISQLCTRFYVAFFFEHSQLLLFTENTTFCSNQPFNGQTLNNTKNYIYEFSALNIQKLNSILNASDIFPLKILGDKNFLRFKRQIRSKSNKTMFYSHLSIEFPCISSHLDIELIELYKIIYSILKINLTKVYGSFQDLQQHPIFTSNEQIFIFPTRISTANAILKAFQSNEEIEFSIQISDFVNYQDMRAKISSKTIQYQKFLHPTAIGAVRQIWCTFQRKNLFFFNQCQVQAQRVLSTFNDKKYVEKLVNEQETIKEIFKDASFSAISVNIGKNILMQEFAKLLGNDIISLVYSIEGQNLLHPSNKQNLIVLSPLGDLYFQRKIGNANCILQLDSIKSEIIIENTNIQQHQDHTNQNQSFTQTQLMHQEQNNSFLNINQLSPIKQTIKEDSFEHQQISKYQSQNEKFCLKFSAGQDYQFPILILDKSQQQKQIQSHQLGLVESANSYKDETMQQDILSLLNDDELD